MKRINPAPTMKDVAREAGVSLGTVSKVINGIPVGESYRRRVEEAERKLGYVLNNYARSLKTNRTDCVALLLPSLRHPFFAALADEVTACLSARGLRCLLMITNYDPEAELASFRLVRQNKVDGVLALTYSPNLDVDDTLPIVTIDRHFAPTVPCVSSDNFNGGQLAAEALLRCGCKRPLALQVVAEVPGEPHKRAAGFESACRRLGAEYGILARPDTEGEEPFFRFLAEHVNPGALEYDGVFCSSDRLAVSVMEFLRARGVRVPEDVQIIGYDALPDHYTGRRLVSSIAQPIPRMAETAVTILMDAERRSSGENIYLPAEYIPGPTTREEIP